MRIAIAQMATRAGELERTCERMAEQSRAAAEKNVDLLVFPMAALCGAAPVAPADREGFLLDVASGVARLVEELACPCLVPVITDLDGVSVAEALLIDDGEVTPVRLSAFFESTMGEGPEDAAGGLPELAFRGARLGVAFSYDQLDEYDDYDYDVDVIVFLSGYGYAVDDPSSALGCALAESRFPADVEATGAWLVGVGSLGCYDEQVFCGSSFVLAPWGELAAQAPSFEEALLVCDVDPSAEGPLEAPLTPEVYDAPLLTWSALSLGLSEACGAGVGPGACALVGSDLSSQLVLALAVDALGPTNVGALVLETGRREEDTLALDLVRALRLPEECVERFDASGISDAALARDVAEAHLAALARRTGRVPLGPTDKTGRALEPAPGVSAARLEPLADLYRSSVVALARLRNTISPVIPQAAFATVRAPEAGGLEDEIASPEARLAFIDVVLSSYVEWDLPVSDIVAERGHARQVEAIVARLRELEGRRGALPPSITLSTRTLDEARGPAGLAWHDRAREAGERLEGRLAQIPQAAADAVSRPPAPPADDPAHDREVIDLLGYLRDFSAGGAFSSLGERRAGRPHAGPGHGGEATGNGGLWEGPFSEN